MSYKNILLMGRSGSGKSSMRNMIFSNYSAIETRRLGATIDVERTHVRILNNLNLSLQDCGGQDSFMLSYINNSKNRFSNVELLIYVFDVEGTQKGDKDIFELILSGLQTYSPNCKIFILVHKMDLITENQREKVFNDFCIDIKKSATKLQFFTQKSQVFFEETSIWDESLYKAWSRIVGSLIPQSQSLQKHLKNLCNIMGAEIIMIFETSTFLKIATYPQELNNETQEDIDSVTQRVSGIIKNYKKSVERVSARFGSLCLNANSKNVYLDSLTDTMVIMIITPDCTVSDERPNNLAITEQKYIDEVLKKARKPFEKLDLGGGGSNNIS